VEFTTSENSNGLFVRTSRGFCGETCPIVGIVWLDDFGTYEKRMSWANKTAFVLICFTLVFVTMAYGGVHQPVLGSSML
jgi:hypothetical protein